MDWVSSSMDYAWTCSRSPFSGGGLLVGPDQGAVEHEIGVVRIAA